MSGTLALNKAKYANLDSSALRSLLRKNGLSVMSWEDAAGTRYSEHCHGEDEIIVVYDGTIRFIVHGDEYLVEAGDELVLPAGTKHQAVNSGRGPVQYFICK